MLRFIVLSAFAAVALATPILDTTLDKHWEMWKDHHSKTYDDKHEELKRRIIWEDNLQTINLHNLEHSMGMHTYTMGMNHFGDLVRNSFQFSPHGSRGKHHVTSWGVGGNTMSHHGE